MSDPGRFADDNLNPVIRSFSEEYLSSERGFSANTLQSYRDSIRLWIQFVARESGRSVESLGVRDFTAERVERFLAYLQVDRGNSIATQNSRLSALRHFARFLGIKNPEERRQVHSILALPRRQWRPAIHERVSPK